MSFEFWIGSRYAGFSKGKQKNRDRFVSFLANSTMIGIALSVAILIIVMSVMNGFRSQVRDRMLSILPHIQVYNVMLDAKSQLDHWQDLADVAYKNPDVLGASPFVMAGAMVTNGQTIRGVQVQGIDPNLEENVSDLPKQIILGDLQDLKAGEFNIVMGSYLANGLGVKVGDKVLLFAPQGSVGPTGFTPRMRQFKVVAIFSSGHYEYDSSMAFVNDYDAAALFKQTAVAGVRLKIKNMIDAPEVAYELAGHYPFDISIKDWTQDNRTWFAAVKTEKRMMFLILCMLVAVAAFNLLSSLVMTVKEKQSDIAILRTLGAHPSAVARIFMIQGSLVGIMGTVLGVGFGCLIAANIDVIVPFIERLFGVHFLDPSIYFISALPSEIQLYDVVFVSITSIVLSFLATLYPSWRASRLQPAEVLRHD
ncbi:lipoprotein-releasing ABC transporter permease subunit [Basilea psittacipulmonis]|uniref:Cell division protein FtsX n=1 Tax=Basilea psittacipulmonis DSM 24701 TaxID=1072685 RepID=A0A077DD71_9BURK|nr:lipoprotein-releasing ABC transporter permease subunit [Basilea psittacipulmonis]AIL32554.1 cell division protein FtsX [Basilea psittacipulmonis DSM 24701]